MFVFRLFSLLIKSDDVCVLSVIGTAAVINHQFTTNGEKGKRQTVALLPSTTGPLTTITPLMTTKEIPNEKNDTEPKNGDVKESTTTACNQNASNQTPTGCELCHITYNKHTLPVNGKMKKCAVCK